MAEVSIMIVDDSEPERYLTRRIVKRAAKNQPRIRKDIFAAVDGREALDFLLDQQGGQATHGSAFPPGLILLDLNMPRMSGFEFLEAFQQLRGQETSLSETVVSIFTSSSHDEDRTRALSFEFVTDYIVKPLSEEQLIALVDKHFGV